MPPKYKNPPLIEAVFELRFDPNVSWDLTVPGRLYERLQSDFPEKKSAPGVEITLKPLAEPPAVRPIERLQILSTDRKCVVQLLEHSLAIARLSPYNGWENYRPVVQRVVAEYRRVAGDTKTVRTGLKYVNKIVIPHVQFPIEDYFDLYPFLGKSLPAAHGPFFVGVVFPFGEQDNLKVEITTGNPDVPASYPVMFTLDYFTTVAEGINLAGLEPWLDTAHGRVEEVFEATLKENARVLFGPRE